MEKNIKDYLHYYLGCDVVWREQPNQKYSLRTIDEHSNKYDWNGCFIFYDADDSYWVNAHEIKPILRKLESMEGDEAIELAKLVTELNYHDSIEIFTIKPKGIHYMDGTKWYGDGVEEYNDCEIYFNNLTPEQFHYLLSRGFDLFGLIDAGLAKEKQTQAV